MAKLFACDKCAATHAIEKVRNIYLTFYDEKQIELGQLCESCYLKMMRDYFPAQFYASDEIVKRQMGKGLLNE